MKLDDRSLEELLQAAGDAAEPPSELPPDLARRVRQLHARRRRTRQTTTAAFLGILLTAGVLSSMFYPRPPLQAPQRPMAGTQDPQPDRPARMSAEEVERLLARIERLDAEARERRRAVERLIRQERATRQLIDSFREPPGPDPLELARIEIEKTAFLLVARAEQQTASSPDEFPARQYRRIIEHFPNTRGARIAQEKLSQFPNEKGDL